MFEDGAKLDSIMNVLRRPTLDDDDEKKDQRITDAAIRYDTKRAPVDCTINFEFAGQKISGGL